MELSVSCVGITVTLASNSNEQLSVYFISVLSTMGGSSKGGRHVASPYDRNWTQRRDVNGHGYTAASGQTKSMEKGFLNRAQRQRLGGSGEFPPEIARISGDSAEDSGENGKAER